MKNLTGAGWTVATQQERGWFYQNFTLALIESQVCVGWHWFKYKDNDPRDRTTDPSNRDAQFCVTQNESESLLCCPSPGLGCQAAAEAAGGG